ncbi:MAG TPA: GNAT family N-acetyltransferase [Ktedonobacterales bacterium]|nr:GNAT family N-acetyltransferase [Ktedonobacterales bacterium]
MAIDEAFTTVPTLTTRRLRLRGIRPNDAEAIFATASDEETMRFIGRAIHRTIEDTRDYMQLQQLSYAERTVIRWGITLRDDDDRVIGSCSLHHFDEGYHRAEVGYELNRAHWGQGIMPEAVSAVLTYGFTEMGLHRIEAIIDDANARSKSLLLKLGFQYEGNLRQRFVSRKGFEDEYYYGLLRDEWRP